MTLALCIGNLKALRASHVQSPAACSNHNNTRVLWLTFPLRPATTSTTVVIRVQVKMEWKTFLFVHLSIALVLAVCANGQSDSYLRDPVNVQNKE